MAVTEDRFELIEQIGVGGMATVWRAKDRQLERQVAIKRLAPHLANDPAAAARFTREARAAASLNHPGIVTIYDTREDAEGPYLVLELVEGETLAQRLRREGRLSPPVVATIIGQAAKALDHAHSQGIVHRDIKPSNLIIDEGGRVRITDFGIAKIVDDSATVTDPTNLLGTIVYMAPEVLEGNPATTASDVYSLGAVTHELLTGAPPFEAEGIEALAKAIRTGAHKPLTGVDDQTASAVERAMSVKPDERPGTAAAFYAALVATTTLPIDRASVAAPTASPAPTSSVDEPTVELTGPGSPRKRWGPLAAVGALLILTLLLIASIGDSPAGPADTTAAAASTVEQSTTSESTTSTTASTTTSSTLADTPEALAGAIAAALGEMRPPEFKPNDVGKVEDGLAKSMEAWAEDDRDKLREELEKTFEAVSRLPESSERDEIFAMLADLAEAMGFEVNTTRREN